MKMKTTSFRVLVYVIIAFAFISGCKKAEEDPATCQIINNCLSFTSGLDSYFNGSLYEVIVYSYAGNEIVKEYKIGIISSAGGKSEIFEVAPGCDKIRLSFKFLPASSANYNSANNIRLYVVASKRIQKGASNILTLQGNVLVSTSSLIQGEETFFLLGDANKFIKI
jgi:hypothetical protein